MYTIQNNRIAISVSPRGAELQSLLDKQSGKEYLWQANPAFWGKHSPILFPIVGALKDGVYKYKGTTYALPRHGFAREMDFELHRQDAKSLSLLLRSNTETLKKFPFAFELYIEYALTANGISVTYSIQNIGSADMLFSIGGHPAFNLPLSAGENYEDYVLEFNKEENEGRWLLQDGLLKNGTTPLLTNTRLLPLKKELFYADAIVLKNLKSNKVKLASKKTGEGFEFSFEGFPYLGIWAAKDADFICIEPWCGIADSVESNQELSDKEGIINLAAGKQFNRTWAFATL